MTASDPKQDSNTQKVQRDAYFIRTHTNWACVFVSYWISLVLNLFYVWIHKLGLCVRVLINMPSFERLKKKKKTVSPGMRVNTKYINSLLKLFSQILLLLLFSSLFPNSTQPGFECLSDCSAGGASAVLLERRTHAPSHTAPVPASVPVACSAPRLRHRSTWPSWRQALTSAGSQFPRWCNCPWHSCV